MQTDESSQFPYDEKRRDFLDYYAQNEATLHSCGEAIVNILNLLKSQTDFKDTKVAFRIKDKYECLKKFDLKYRQTCEESGCDYHIKDYVSDIIGIRLICLYESQIPGIVGEIEKQFKVLKKEDKTAEMHQNLHFGYKGLHVDLMIDDKRGKLPEYSAFSEFKIELQVRSIVQDAWSEVDHKLKYKKSIPNSLKRRIVRLAALFEMADQEFDEIRRSTEQIEKKILDSTNLDQAVSNGDLENSAFDAFSFLNFVGRRYRGYVFEPEKVDGFVEEIIQSDPGMTIKSFSDIFDSHFDVTQEYREEMRKQGININPFTHIRHMLIMYDDQKFATMLYPPQRYRFQKWLSSQK